MIRDRNIPRTDDEREVDYWRLFVKTQPSVAKFTDLVDSPSSYSGQGGKFVAVKSSESGLEFVTSKNMSRFPDLVDVPEYSGPHLFPKVNSDNNGIEFRSVVVVQPTAPAYPYPGMIWVDTSTS